MKMNLATRLLVLTIIMTMSVATVSATHDANATLTPLWSPANTNVDYTVEICNEEASTHELWRLEVIKNNLYSGFGCADLEGWFKSEGSFYDPELGAVTQFCQYNVNGTPYNIQPDTCEVIDFSATTPEEEDCNLLWKFRTYDNENPFGGVWETTRTFTGVDSTIPVIEKELSAPDGETSGDCLPNPDNFPDEVCWVTDNAVISVDAYDPGDLSCEGNDVVPSGLTYCTVIVEVDEEVDDSYSMTIYDNDENDENDADNYIEFDVSFNEDTIHDLIITCYDEAGNEIEDAERFKVDITEPETEINLEAGNEYYASGESQWLDTDSAISVTADDKDPNGEYVCAIGLDETYVRTFYFPEEEDWDPCESASACENFDAPVEQECKEVRDYYDGGLGWIYKTVCTDSNPFTAHDGELINPGEESCHVIESYSVDEFGNTEDVQRECYFVDKTPPTISKEVGKPGVLMPESDDDYFVTMETDITLNCVDGGDHPAGGETIYWLIEKTEDGENWEVMSNQSEQTQQKVFNFAEPSLHRLSWYCEDAVGKTSELDVELFGVDEEAPIINKTVHGEYLGNCDPAPHPEADEEQCYLKGTESSVLVQVEDTEAIHMSNNVQCRYKVEWNDEVIDSGTFGEEGMNFTWDEDSAHILTLYCYDAVGNSVEDVEVFLVDITPPVTTKTYGEDSIEREGYRWMTSETDVTLDAVDEKVGVYGIYYNHEWVSNETCEAHPDEPATEPSTTEYNIPSTNDDNRNNGWAHVNLLSTGAGEVELEFVQPRNFYSCFEYRTDGDTSEVIDEEHFLEFYEVVDESEGLQQYPQFCLNTISTQIETIEADAYVEVRMIVGAEGDERWDWVRFDVLPDMSEWTFVEDDTTTFNIPESSCHIIQYASEDLLGNLEVINEQYVMVDNEAPWMNKIVGDPKVIDECVPEEGEPQRELFDAASVGDEIHTIDFPEGADTGVGVAFDGEFLYYTYIDSTNLYKIRPDGTGHEVIPTSGVTETGLGALAWDEGRGKLWAGTYGCREGDTLPVYLIDPVTGVAEFQFVVSSVHQTYCLDDGIAYDATDDSIYFTDDVSSNMAHYEADGTFIETIDTCAIDGRLCSHTSGVAIGGENLYLGTNGNDVTLRVNKDSYSLLDEFVNTDFRIEDMECDPFTYAPTEVMWVRDAFAGSARAYEIEPGTCGFAGQPPEEEPGDECEGDLYINQQTPITMYCEDSEPHPVNDVTLNWRYRFNEECGEWTDQDWSEWNTESTEEKTIYFQEDSCHQLEYYCVDALGNEAEHVFEIDIVDTQGPVITEKIVGPKHVVDECPQAEISSDVVNDCEPTTYIDGVTTIEINATDVDPHPVGGVYCEWGYWWNDQWYEGGNESELPFIIANWSESQHDLEVVCRDALGNSAEFYKTYEVDHTPPYIWKEYSPFYIYEEEYWAKYIGVDTLIYAGVQDQGPHLSGVKEVKYKISLDDDEACMYNYREVLSDKTLNVENDDYTYSCDEASSEEGWTTVEEWNEFNFTANEESCHLIEIMATDNVDKCALHKQWVYVDNSSPTTNKTIGLPKTVMSEQNQELGAAFYPELAQEGFCDQVDENGNPKCSEVTLLTPIELGCYDPEPHPSGAVDVCYMVDFDGTDLTEQYCGEGDYNGTGNGYCCLDVDQEVEFYFTEETWHKLSYYCVDNVGNSGEEDVDVEYFKVEGTAFEIQLNKKWNLISVPVKLLDDSMDEVFMPHQDTVEAVWTYNDGVWSVYTPDGNPANDDLTTMLPGWGYWILSTDEDLVTIGGSLLSPAVTPPSKTISAGWNLIGYYGADGQTGYYGPNGNGGTVSCELFSLTPTVFDYGVSSVYSYWEPLSQKWLEFSFPDNMDPGAGYWVYAYEDGQYVPSTVCNAGPQAAA